MSIGCCLNVDLFGGLFSRCDTSQCKLNGTTTPHNCKKIWCSRQFTPPLTTWYIHLLLLLYLHHTSSYVTHLLEGRVNANPLSRDETNKKKILLRMIVNFCFPIGLMATIGNNSIRTTCWLSLLPRHERTIIYLCALLSHIFLFLSASNPLWHMWIRRVFNHCSGCASPQPVNTFQSWCVCECVWPYQKNELTHLEPPEPEQYWPLLLL